jgi:hypothetical protein
MKLNKYYVRKSLVPEIELNSFISVYYGPHHSRDGVLKKSITLCDGRAIAVLHSTLVDTHADYVYKVSKLYSVLSEYLDFLNSSSDGEYSAQVFLNKQGSSSSGFITVFSGTDITRDDTTVYREFISIADCNTKTYYSYKNASARKRYIRMINKMVDVLEKYLTFIKNIKEE